MDQYQRQPVIIVPFLDPNYYLLFGHLKLIVSEFGSPLSHLAIVAREHNLPVFLSPDLINQIPSTGKCQFDQHSITFPSLA